MPASRAVRSNWDRGVTAKHCEGTPQVVVKKVAVKDLAAHLPGFVQLEQANSQELRNGQAFQNRGTHKGTERFFFPFAWHATAYFISGMVKIVNGFRIIARALHAQSGKLNCLR